MSDAFDQLDQKQPQQGQPPAAAGQPQAAAPQPQAGGDAFDQLPADKPATPAINTTKSPAPSLGERALTLEGKAFGWALPDDNKVLNWVNEHVAQPPVRMGREAGNILVNHGLGLIGEAMHPFDDAPANMKGLESAYWKDRVEKEDPRLAGVASSILDTVGNIGGNPTNWPLMGAGAARSALARTFAKAFGVEMAKDTLEEGKDLWDNWGTMNSEQKYKRVTDLITHAYFSKKSLDHGALPPKEGPQLEPKPARVVGERPTSQTIAGVETPVSAQHADVIKNNAPVEATDAQKQEMNEFKRTQTAPAATAAMHSVLGQGAEDLIAQHDAISNGEEMPEQVAGTNQPSKYESVDDAANALNQKARSTTYAKADDISEREQQQYQQRLSSALQSQKEGIDHFNQLVDEHNSQLESGESNTAEEQPLQHEQFDPTPIQEEFEKQRPKTYGELKGALDRANAALQSPDAQVREEAVDARDKADKALDGWFKQHSDEISPEEYTSAKKLVYAGARYQEISNGLRAGIDNNNLTGNKLRSIIATVDNKMIRRGEAPGAFQRLVGDDVYNNWRDVARLFDPILTKDPSTMTYGKLALGYITHHFLGPLGMVGKIGAHWVMDKVLSSPEWGNWFKDMSDAVRDKVGQGRDIPSDLLAKFKTMYDNSKSSGEEGAAGANVTPRNVGEPALPKFGRVGLGGSAEPRPLTPLSTETNPDFKMNARDNGDIEMQHPDGESQMVLHPEHDPRPGFEGKSQLRQTGISAVGHPGAGQELMDEAANRLKGSDTYSRVISDYPDRRSPDNEKHWERLADRGHNVQTETSTDSFGEPWDPQWNLEKTRLNDADEGKSYFIPTDTGEAAKSEPKIASVDKPESEIGTRYPRAKAVSGVNNPDEMPNMDAMEQAEKATPGYFDKLVDSLRGYEGSNGMPLEKGGSSKQTVNRVVNHLADNLKWLYNQTPENIRGISKQWYDTAQRMTSEMADKYGVSHEKIAAVTAALSPKNGWDNNVGMADRLVDTWKNSREHPWDTDMEKSLNKITSNPKLKPAFRQTLNTIRGLKYDELTAKTPEALLAKKGLWIRLYDEAHRSKQTPVYAPDGTIRGHQTLTWGMPDPMAKAIKVLEGPDSTQHINDVMGGKNKIRSFYNNIINPNSPRGHVTIDTHAVNADMLKPMGSEDEEVLHNFGGAPGHAATGLGGTYAVHAEAYRRAAADLGIQPRELQSITWEAIRTLFGESKKTPELKAKVNDIWSQYEGNKPAKGAKPKGSGPAKKALTLGQVRDEIMKAANGFDRPVWEPK